MAQVGRGNKLDRQLREAIVRLRLLGRSHRAIAAECLVSTYSVWKVLALEGLIVTR